MLLTCKNSGVIEAGCDEAGRGCLAGPVFAAAVILPPDFEHELISDSKKLTEAMYLCQIIIFTICSQFIVSKSSLYP